MKYVSPSEVGSYFKVKIMAEYQGHELEVIEEKGNMLLITNENEPKPSKLCESLGMTPINKYKTIYQKWIKREEAKMKFEIEELLNNIKMEEV